MRSRILTKVAFSFSLLALLVATRLGAEDKKEVKDDNQPLIGDMRVQTLKGLTYCYASTKTTLEKLGETVNQVLPKVEKGMDEQKIQRAGPPLFRFLGATGDPQQEFTLEIGFPVRGDAQKAGDLKIAKLESWRCASVLYTGPVSGIGAAYEKLMKEIEARHLTPTKESRQLFCYWEGEDSANNIVHVGMGVE